MKRAHMRMATWSAGIILAIALVAYLIPRAFNSNEPVGQNTASPAKVEQVAAVAAPTTSSSNAAEIYRHLITLTTQRRISSNDPQFESYVAGRFNSAAADYFFKDNADIASLLKQAASAPSCDWGEPSLEELQPLMSGMRNLSAFAIARAKWDIHERQFDAALDHFMLAMAAGRHMGMRPQMLAQLVEVAIELRAIDAIAADLPAFSKDQIKSIPTRLNALPAPLTAKQIMAGEYQNALKTAQPQGMVVTAMAQGLEQFYREAGDVMDQSPEQFNQTLDTLIAKYPANPFAKLNGQSLKGQRLTMATVQAKRALLQTATDILQQGDAAAAQSRDPFGKGPFGFTKTPAGFELTSKLQNRGQPVKLVVGRQ